MEQINIRIISDYIDSNNLTKKEFCRQCNISISALDKIMNGKDFDLKSLFKIAKKMNIRICQIFK